MRTAALALLLAAPLVVVAQETRAPRERVAVPWTGPAPQRETVASIMARQALVGPLPARIRLVEKEGPDRSKLLNDPRSPEVSETGSILTKVRNAPPGPRLAIGGQFQAATLTDTLAQPPDSQGDVGPTDVLVFLNGRFRSFSKSGVLGAMNTTPETFFSAQRQVGSSFCSDPRVRYDRISQRWYVCIIDVVFSGGSLVGDNRILLAVSDGPTITSSTVWTKYGFAFSSGGAASDAGKFLDYPTLGVDANAVYIGGIIFNTNQTYSSCTALVIRKAPLLTASPVVVSAFRGLAAGSVEGAFCPQGVSNDDPTATVGYFLGVSSTVFGRLIGYRISNPGGTPSISGNLSLTVPSTTSPQTVSVPGGAALDAIDDRLFAAKFHVDRRNGTRRIYAAQNIQLNSSGVAAGSGDRTGARWYEIAAPDTGALTLSRSGTAYDPAASSPQRYWMPDVALNGAGDVILGYSRGNSTTAPGIGVTAYRRGTTTPIDFVAVAGSGTYDSGGGNRWGDYSLTAVDPGDGLTTWTFQMRVNANNSYAVHAVPILADAPPAMAIGTRTSIRRGQTATVRYTKSSGNGIFVDPGTGFPSRPLGLYGGAGLAGVSLTVIDDNTVDVVTTATATAALGAQNFTYAQGDGQTSTLTGALTVRATAPVSGTIALGNFVGTTAGKPYTLVLRDASNVALETLNVTTNGAGATTGDTLLPAGTYRLAIRGGTFLRKVIDVTLTDDGLVAPFSVTLVNGDVNGDNQVGTADLSSVSARQGATTSSGNYLAAADLDGSGTIDATDLNIVRTNFRQKGDL